MEFTENISEQRDGGQIKRQIQRYVQWWPLFLGCLLLGLFGAWLYLRYATPQYMSKSSLYVKSDNGKQGGMMG